MEPRISSPLPPKIPQVIILAARKVNHCFSTMRCFSTVDSSLRALPFWAVGLRGTYPRKEAGPTETWASRHPLLCPFPWQKRCLTLSGCPIPGGCPYPQNVSPTQSVYPSRNIPLGSSSVHPHEHAFGSHKGNCHHLQKHYPTANRLPQN